MRDLRDPQKLGEWLLSSPTRPLSRAYDVFRVTRDHISDVSKDDSMGKECVREYRTELEIRAAGGDKYAKSAIESIDAGKGVQGYDDAGS